MCRRVYLSGLLLFLCPSALAAQPAALDSIAAILSPELATAEERLCRVGGLEPQPRPMPSRCPALGYHSRAATSPQQIRWVQVDLGASSFLDYVVLVPAVGPGGEGSPGYHFPPRFHIELSDDPDFNSSTTVAELAIEGAAVTHPVVIPTPRAKARFLRVTATRLSGQDGRYFFALGELAAVSGNLNLAAGRPVTACDSIENPPVWGLRYLVDGQCMVGPPQSSVKSFTNGYHAAISPTQDAEKWVQVDLGAEFPLDEVRLVPARPSDFPDRSGFGFPLRFRVEASTSPGFDSPIVLMDATGSDFPNPGDGLVVAPGRGLTARFVRITATRLWERTGDFVFALAELQVYAGGRNVARNKEVSALDSIERGLWAKQYLVDGFASLHGLTEWPQWAEFELDWAEWAVEMREAEAATEVARARAYTRLVWIAIGMAVAIVLLLAGLAWRLRAVRRREALALRERIARDLHDEVGSNLGGIRLLAEAGTAADLPEIARLTGQTAAALRDLVWLLRGGIETQGDLVAKLRETAEFLLNGFDCRIEAAASGSTDRISADFKRNFYLAFKELLANVARHAGGGQVCIRIYRDGRWLILEVKDSGKGFDPNQPAAGCGLRNLLSRAAAVRGDLELHSSPGCGTLVRFIGRIG